MTSLSRLGRLALVGGGALAVGGALGGLEPLVEAGNAVLAGIALAWVATVPVPRRMRRERLEFTWWLPGASTGVRHAGEKVAVRVTLRNPTQDALAFGVPRLALSPGVQHARPDAMRIVVPARSVATFDLEVRASRAGRHVLHGAWMTVGGPLGLAWAPLYFPNPLLLDVQPRAIGAGISQRSVRVADRVVVPGRRARRAGDGAEVRELRDHVPGDPFRRIAWKASARRGKLMVRETDDETRTTRVIVLDASATMRGDEKGPSKLDYAIELVAQATRTTLAAGDRLGLVGVDARVVAACAPTGDPHAMRELVATALALRSTVDEDLTDVDEETLVNVVARYFREQEGADVPSGPLSEAVRRRVAAMASHALRDDAVAKMPVLARDPHSRALRAFCRARALALPLRHDATGSTKVTGLIAGLNAAMDGARERRTIVVLSDLDPVMEVGALKHTLGRARASRHRITFVAPAGIDFAGKNAGDSSVTEAVRAVLLQDEAGRLRDVRRALGAMGAALYTARAKDTFAHWLARAATVHTR